MGARERMSVVRGLCSFDALTKTCNALDLAKRRVDSTGFATTPDDVSSCCTEGSETLNHSSCVWCSCV